MSYSKHAEFNPLQKHSKTDGTFVEVHHGIVKCGSPVNSISGEECWLIVYLEALMFA